MYAVPIMAVFLTSWFPGMSLTYFLNDLEMVLFPLIITGITLAFKFHMRCISIVRFLDFKIFWAHFLITFFSPEIATSINMHVPYYYYYYYYYYYIIDDNDNRFYRFLGHITNTNSKLHVT